MMTVRNASSQPVLVVCGGKNALLYHRKRDMDAVKEAEDRGYFVTVNQEFLEGFLSRNKEKRVGEKEVEKKIGEKEVEKKVGEKEVEKKVGEKKVEKKVGEKKVEKKVGEKKVEKKIGEKAVEKKVGEKEVEKKVGEKAVEIVRFLALNCLHVRHLDGLATMTTVCSNLTILLLADNFIERIDVLASCSELLKLDLHGNQISILPDSSFWKGFRRLRILHLHDNPIGRYRTIDGLSVCQSLTLLTLSDTPISVRRFYRHHVINTIWSLKALDRYVVSDEEIIEGARFGGRFAAQSLAFQLPPSSSVSHKPIAESADDAEASVWKVTGRVNSILAHHSPVVIIQRYWRGYLTRQAIRWAVETELWAVVTIQRRYREWKAACRGGGNKMPIMMHRLSTTSMATTSLSSDRCTGTTLSAKFDYDSYLMSRRPLSSAFCRFSPMPGTRARPPSADIGNDANLPNETISFDLTKLEMNIDEQLAREYVLNDDCLEQTTRKGKSRNQLQRKRSTSLKPRRIKSVREFFGPVVALENPDDDDDDGNSPLTKFRLRGFREEVGVCDPREEIVEKKQSCARFIRLSDVVNHIATNLQAKPTVSRVPLADVRERENRKYRGAIWLTCLQAIGKNYKRVEEAEKAAQQAAYVRRLKETRDGARDRIRSQVTDEQRKSAIISHIEQQGLFEDLRDQQTRNSQVALKYNVVRRQSAQFEKVRRYEAAFAKDFIGRTASCTKADFRFGEQEMREQRTRMKRELVSGLRDRTADVRDMRKMYMDKRRNHVQSDSNAERDELRKRMTVEMQERIEVAQSRVAELRRSKTDVGEKRSKSVLVLPIVSDPHGPTHRSRTCDSLDAR